MPDLTRIGFPGEIPGVGSELVVIDDNVAEILPDQPSTAQVRVIAHIAVLGFVRDQDRSHGFTGEWHDVQPDSSPISVRIVGAKGIGHALRVLAGTEGPEHDAHQEIVRTRDGHRYYLRTHSP